MDIDSTSIAMLVTLLILVAMSAYFSATETAFTSLNRIRLKNRADNGSRRPKPWSWRRSMTSCCPPFSSATTL